MSRRSAVRVGRIVAGVVVAGLVAYLAAVGLDKADKVGSALGLVVAVLGLVAPYLLPPFRQRSTEPVPPVEGGSVASDGINVRGGQGVQINLGGTNTQTNTFPSR